ncbi:hypothetical protein LE181_05800 [Streptomyces sp. SCA3-4]|uniref:hypothetical protein n=1 Tax=Streptomyces sichuanensis TaxID=2871810 RepID=UPI001CE33C0C|nr:hypothetical protein [Streptomyces sichuanensis]MCA6091678.1 hypothetical protein [Streptomyces sichuanensis]
MSRMPSPPLSPAAVTATAEPRRDDHVTARRLLRAGAIAACVPYLALKVAWLAGSRIGIPEGSAALEHETLLKAANALTLLMDTGVIVLALLLTCPWGRRAPSWLLVLPMWGAVGLLTPVIVGFPARLALGMLGATDAGHPADGRPFLDEWVFTVVYSGFIVQGLALGALFVLYARGRWGHLWQGSAGDPAARLRGRWPRGAAVAAAVLAVGQAGAHLVWSSGVRTGLPGAMAGRSGADAAVQEAAYVLYGAAAVAGIVLLLSRRAVPLWVPLLLTGVGSAALGCWGGWLLTTGLVQRAATPPAAITYAVQVIIGLLVLAGGAHYFHRRSTP